MLKNILFFGFAITLSFAGLSDDLQTDNQKNRQIEEMIHYVDGVEKECRNIRFYERQEYMLDDLERLYNQTDTANGQIQKINEIYKSKISAFLATYRNSSDLHDILDKVGVTPYYSRDGDKAIEDICSIINNKEQYRTDIKQRYKSLENELKIEEQAKKSEANKEAKIAKVKEIIETKLMSESGSRGSYSLAEYDTFLKTARDTWDEIETFKNEDGRLIIEERIHINYSHTTYDDYIARVEDEKKYKQNLISKDKVNQKNIPAYKQWKSTTVPKFQKNLKAGDYVIGGIIWKVDGDLVVIDTGNKGLVSQRRNQTFPRVPQDLMPLYLNEIYGVAKY
jgi:hypothetical protein